MSHYLVVVFALAFFVYVSINALYMLISPRAWFRLPLWMQLSGSLRAKRAKYKTGVGALQVRILGAVFLVCAFWLLFAFIR